MIRGIFKTYGKTRGLIIIAAVTAIFIIALFVTGLCVHDYAKAESSLRYYNFASGENYKISPNTRQSDFIEEYKTVVDTGEYERYGNIFKYDILTADGNRIFELGFDKLVYFSDDNVDLIFRVDDSLPNKSLRAEQYVCSQLRNFGYADCRCNMGNTKDYPKLYEVEDLYYDFSTHTYKEIKKKQDDYLYSYLHIDQNKTYREIKEEIDDGVNSWHYNIIDRYEVIPTYDTIDFGIVAVTDPDYFLDTGSDGWGLGDLSSRSEYFTAVAVVYVSSDVEVLGASGPTWDMDALGIEIRAE